MQRARRGVDDPRTFGQKMIKLSKRWVIAVLLSAMLYLLSFGPVAGFYLPDNPPPPRSVTVVYAPLYALSRINRPRNPIFWYAMLCDLILWRRH